MKKIRLIAFIICLLSVLTSCNIGQFDSENMLTPPQMNASNQQIHDALTKSVGGSYDLVYPKSGSYQNAILSADLTGDGMAEALCFYTTEQDKRVHLSVLEKEKGEWKVKDVSHSQTVSAELSSIDFFDVNKDGTKEIVVSWQYLSAEERAIDIFNFVDSRIKNLFTGLYGNIIVLDTALVTVSRNTNTRTATASVIGKSGETVAVVGTAALGNSIASFVNVQSAYAGDNCYNIFIDEQLENSSFTTEVLQLNAKNDISNITVDLDLTARNSSVVCTDVNDDGMPDIPIEKKFAPYDIGEKTESLYYMEWHSIKGEKKERLMNAYTSVNEHFLLELPEEWTDRITVQKDKSSDRRLNFYMLGEEQHTPMFCLRVFSQQEFADDLRAQGWESVVTHGENVYAITRDSSTLLPEEFRMSVDKFKELFTIMN